MFYRYDSCAILYEKTRSHEIWLKAELPMVSYITTVHWPIWRLVHYITTVHWPIWRLVHRYFLCIRPYTMFFTCLIFTIATNHSTNCHLINCSILFMVTHRHGNNIDFCQVKKTQFKEWWNQKHIFLKFSAARIRLNACPSFTYTRLWIFTQYYSTHWGRDKMAAIFQTAFWNAFFQWKCINFDSDFSCSLFLRVQSTIFHHWFR